MPTKSDLKPVEQRNDIRATKPTPDPTIALQRRLNEFGRKLRQAEQELAMLKEYLGDDNYTAVLYLYGGERHGHLPMRR